MRRIILGSLLLIVLGIFLPLAFLPESEARDGPTPPPQVSPSPTTVLPSTPPTATQPTTERDEETVFNLQENGETREMTMAEYLPYALAAEMPMSFNKEAIKAQAVAARTYTIYCTEHENPKHPEADVCADSGCCLAYLDEKALRASWGDAFDANMQLAQEAVAETDGEILIYNNEPILASFHSSSAGMTEDGVELWGDVPYLINVNSPETADDVPNFVTTVEVTAENLKESILLLYPETAFADDIGAWLGATELDESGRVRNITISGTTLSGSEMRKLFSLRSTAFTLNYDGTAFMFTVTGYGHGLGLSQYGANVMGKGGFTYKEILLHYYPDTELV